MKKMQQHTGLDRQQRTALKAGRIGNATGFNGLRHHKAKYDQVLQQELYDEFEFVYFTSTSRCSVQLSGLLYPDFDFQRRQLQDLSDWSSPLELITFFTAPNESGWAFCFAWHASSDRICTPFIQSLAACVSDGAKPEDLILRFALSCCENHAIRVSWWDALPQKAKQAALYRMRLMGHPDIPVLPNYLTEGYEGMADWNFHYVHTTLEVQ